MKERGVRIEVVKELWDNLGKERNGKESEDKKEGIFLGEELSMLACFCLQMWAFPADAGESN